MRRIFNLYRVNIKNAFLFCTNNRQNVFCIVINFLFFVSLTLTLTIGRTYPLHLIANTVLVVMLLVMCIYIFLYRLIRLDIYIVSIFGISLIIFISALLNGVEQENFSFLILVLSMVPIYLYFKSLEHNLRIVVYLITCAYLIFNLYFFAIYFRQFINFDFSNRLGSKIANENDIATYLLTAHCIFLALLLKRKIIILPFIVLNFIEMLSTGSRSGLLGILIASVIIVYCVVGQKYKIKFLVLVVIAIVILYSLLFLPSLNNLRLRINDMFVELIFRTGKDESIANRLELLSNSLEAFLRSPIFGNGRDFASLYTFDGDVAHNTFIELGASYGIFVLLLYIFLFAFPLYKNRRKMNLFSFAVILSFILFFFSLSGYYYKPPYYILPALVCFDEKTFQVEVLIE